MLSVLPVHSLLGYKHSLSHLPVLRPQSHTLQLYQHKAYQPQRQPPPHPILLLPLIFQVSGSSFTPKPHLVKSRLDCTGL